MGTLNQAVDSPMASTETLADKAKIEALDYSVSFTDF